MDEKLANFITGGHYSPEDVEKLKNDDAVRLKVGMLTRGTLTDRFNALGEDGRNARNVLLMSDKGRPRSVLNALQFARDNRLLDRDGEKILLAAALHENPALASYLPGAKEHIARIHAAERRGAEQANEFIYGSGKGDSRGYSAQAGVAGAGASSHRDTSSQRIDDRNKTARTPEPDRGHIESKIAVTEDGVGTVMSGEQHKALKAQEAKKAKLEAKEEKLNTFLGTEFEFRGQKTTVGAFLESDAGKTGMKVIDHLVHHDTEKLSFSERWKHSNPELAEQRKAARSILMSAQDNGISVKGIFEAVNADKTKGLYHGMMHEVISKQPKYIRDQDHLKLPTPSPDHTSQKDVSRSKEAEGIRSALTKSTTHTPSTHSATPKVREQGKDTGPSR